MQKINNSPKLIIFDCDGTLVDSEYLCNLGLEIKLKEYGVESSAHEMLSSFRGMKLAVILEALEKRHQIELNEAFVPAYRSLVDELFEKELQPCEGVADMLSVINLPKCVASNGPLEKMRLALRVTELSGYFNDKFFSAYDISSWKPDPGLFLYAAKEMGIQPNECIVVEDSPLGISAAKSAGMLSVFYDPHDIHAPIEGVPTIRHMKDLADTI